MSAGHRGPIGSTCSMYHDTDRDLGRYDVLRSRAGTCYRVVEIKRTKKLEEGGIRYTLTVLRITPHMIETDDKVHDFYWYSRNRRKG
jgi:hypothetical protein